MKRGYGIFKRALSTFQEILNAELEFVQSINDVCIIKSGVIKKLKKREREKLCEMSFLVMCTAWESFLEFTFEHYMVYVSERWTPVKSKAGFKVNSIKVAREIIAGESHQPWVSWIEPDKVIKRSELYFKDGEPYAAILGGAKKDLEIVRIVRNRIAHKSRTSETKFLDRLRALYGIGKKLSPGGFLLDLPPTGLYKGAVSYQTVFEYLKLTLESASKLLVK